MEVHHHPEVEKKHFKDYLLEGLMIFVAVTLGFFAEGLREHVNDRSKEHEYLISLSHDLKRDIAGLDGVIKYKANKISIADSVFATLRGGDIKNNTANLYYWGRLLGQRIFFEQNNGTIQQLNNAGGLRLIHKQIVVDSLQSYMIRIKTLDKIQALEEAALGEYRRSAATVFDGVELDKTYISKTSLAIKKPDHNPPLISYDKKDLNQWCINALYVKSTRLGQLVYLDNVRVAAQKLVDLIQKEYHLEDE